MEEIRQERRERQRRREKAKMPQHGKSLARTYKNAVSRRAKGTKTEHGKNNKKSI
jgi:hypothetical protein